MARQASDVRHRYMPNTEEARHVLASALVAWRAAISRVVQVEASETIVRTLLEDRDIPLWTRPFAYHARVVRQVFDAHWPQPIVLPFEPLLFSRELA